MTKSRKQRKHDADVAHERSNLLTVGIVVAAILITVLVLAS
ncbi:hypothetical protein [Kordiimonas aestuarii]|nr:hypothetical protein [Kordiimonas aestuarii]